MPFTTRLLAVTLMLCAVLGVPTSGRAADDAWGRDYLPDVTVVTQDGESKRFYSDILKGKLTVISFIYTSCRDICPIVTARLAEVQDQLGDDFGKDVFFVSVSIDPKTDTPARLNAHAKAFSAKPGWVFLTGAQEDIDLIRYKLGERSRKITEHRSEILLRNDTTGEWAKDSVFGDITKLVTTIRAMDPVYRATLKPDTSDSANYYPLPDDGGFPGEALYLRACGGCHTVGKGDKVGPDLKDVTRRRERAWLDAFLTSPQAMHAKGDPIAKELALKFPDVRMPNVGLAEADIRDLVAYIEAQSHAAQLAAQDGDSHHHHPEPAKSGSTAEEAHDHGAHQHH